MHESSPGLIASESSFKWGPANGVVYTFAKICVKSFFHVFSHKTRFTIQLIQLSDAMRPEDGSCMDKVNELYSRLKFYHVKATYTFTSV